MLEFLTLKPETFGLDISDFSLKIAKIKKKGKFLSLASFGEEEIPFGIIKNGEIKDEEVLAKIIKKAILKVKGEKIKTKYVIASLPEEKSFLQVIQMPKIPEKDLKSAVVYEAENYIPLPIEEVYLDYQIIKPISNHLDHQDVLISALPRKIIDSYLSCLKKADLIPLAFEIESLSIARALIKNNFSSLPVLIIDFGASRTSFIIFSGYSIRFTGSISISSQQFTEIISQSLKTDFKKAEELKIKHGLNIVEKIIFKKKIENNGLEREIVGERKIFEVLTPALTDLLEQIKKYLDFYQTHNFHEHIPAQERRISKILISGGGANLKGLTDFLLTKLRIPILLGNPWINILPEPLKEIPDISFEESLKYTTALGLSLRGINYD